MKTVFSEMSRITGQESPKCPETVPWAADTASRCSSRSLPHWVEPGFDPSRGFERPTVSTGAAAPRRQLLPGHEVGLLNNSRTLPPMSSKALFSDASGDSTNKHKVLAGSGRHPAMTRSSADRDVLAELCRSLGAAGGA